MLNKIKAQLSKIFVEEVSAAELFVADETHYGGKVEIYSKEPEIEYLYLSNKNCVSINFIGFLNNALEIEVGKYEKQTECLVFPKTENTNDWILTIETKYSNSIENAFRKSNDYPNITVGKIIKTVEFLRNKELIPKNKRVHAIVSFPKLIQDFSESFLVGHHNEMDILIKHKILIRATNKAEIISDKRIKI